MTRRIGKKGSLDDLVYIIGVLLFFGMLLLIMGNWMSKFSSEIQGLDHTDQRSKRAVNQVNDLYGGALDNSFLFLAIGLAIVALIFAGLVIVHPIFFIFYFIMLSIVIFVSGAISNVYQEAAAHPELAAVAARLVFTTHILTYLPFITGVLGFILAIVMYKNWQGAQ